MDYNTTRRPLIIPEYGRHVQKMVDHCMTIKDDVKRNEFAGIIVEVMGELNPHLRDIPDFQHKLWDQLFIMSNFRLEVDSPFPKLTREIIQARPNRMAYPKEEFKYKYYGKNIRRMIDVALSWEGDKREGLEMVIANHMKKCYLIWNKDTVDDKTIFNHLYELSNGKIDLRDGEEALLSSDRLQVNTSSNKTTAKKKGKSNRNKQKHK